MKLFSKIQSQIDNLTKDSVNAKNLLGGSFWSLFGVIISKGLLFVTWILIARFLGSHGYGQFGIIRNTVLMLISFSGLSLGLTISKHISEFIKEEKQRVNKIVTLVLLVGIITGVIMSLALYFFAPYLTEVYLKAPEIKKEFQLCSIILFFSSINGVCTGILQGFMKYKQIAIINIIQVFISAPFFLIGAIFYDIIGVVLALVFSYFIIAVLSVNEVRKIVRKEEVKFNFSEAFDEWRILVSYSLPAFLSTLMVSPVKWYTESLLVTSSGFSEMGIFVAAMTFNGIIIMSINMVSSPFISVLSRNKGKENLKLLRFNIMGPWFLGVIISLPLLLFPELGITIFGGEYQNEGFLYTFSFIILFTVVMMFKQGLYHLVAVYNLQWWSLLSNFVWAIALISFFYSTDKTSVYLSQAYLFSYILNVIFLIPVYYRYKIIPSKTIEMKESFFIWGLIFLSFYLGLNIKSILYKVILFLLIVLLVVFLFRKILKKSNVKISN